MLTTSSQPSDYLPLALRCRSKNEFNLLHIAFENILAPVEFTYFMDLVATQQLPKQTYDWLRKIAGLSPGLYDAPQRFRRDALAENVLLYRNPTENDGSKTLLIGFAGNARRLMMPIAIFLQCLDSRLWDVLLLRKGLEQSNYLRGGVRGVAGNFPDLVEYVRKAASRRQVLPRHDLRDEWRGVCCNLGGFASGSYSRRFGLRGATAARPLVGSAACRAADAICRASPTALHLWSGL